MSDMDGIVVLAPLMSLVVGLSYGLVPFWKEFKWVFGLIWLDDEWSGETES